MQLPITLRVHYKVPGRVDKKGITQYRSCVSWIDAEKVICECLLDPKVVLIVIQPAGFYASQQSESKSAPIDTVGGKADND